MITGKISLICGFKKSHKVVPEPFVILEHADVVVVNAIVSLSFFAFNTNGNRGVACGLGNIQKVRDGEPLGGRTNAASEFETLDDEDFLS